MISVDHATHPARLRANVARRNIEKTYTARYANSTKTLQDAFRVRHSSFLSYGYIEPKPGGLFFDEYDNLASSHTVVVYEDERPVGSVRVCFLSEDDLGAAPVGNTYPDEVSQLLKGLPRRRSGPQAVEITRLTRSPEAENNQGLVFLLLRVAGYLAIQEDVSLLMSCVRQNHVPFYRRIGCHVASEPKPCPGLQTSAYLLACPRSSYDTACAAFPIMNPLSGPSDSLAALPSGKSVTMPLLPHHQSSIGKYRQ